MTNLQATSLPQHDFTENFVILDNLYGHTFKKHLYWYIFGESNSDPNIGSTQKLTQVVEMTIYPFNMPNIFCQSSEPTSDQKKISELTFISTNSAILKTSKIFLAFTELSNQSIPINKDKIHFICDIIDNRDGTVKINPVNPTIKFYCPVSLISKLTLRLSDNYSFYSLPPSSEPLNLIYEDSNEYSDFCIYVPSFNLYNKKIQCLIIIEPKLTDGPIDQQILGFLNRPEGHMLIPTNTANPTITGNCKLAIRPKISSLYLPGKIHLIPSRIQIPIKFKMLQQTYATLNLYN